MSSQHPNESGITPHGETTFEYVVRRLNLSLEEYAGSRELKEWVRKNKDHKYVPLYLLELWGLEVNVDMATGGDLRRVRQLRRRDRAKAT